MTLIHNSLLALGAFISLASAQGPAAVVCIPGQCLSGFSNLTMGAKVTAPESPLPLILLPGQYTTTTNPQLLHDVLTSSSMSMSSSAGFNTSSDSLPVDLTMTPGLALFSAKLYGGQSAFSDVPSSPPSDNSGTILNTPGSIGLADNVWAAVTSSSSNTTAVFWESVPDVAQLPPALSGNQLSLNHLQSSRCSPPCSSAGVCTPSGTCACKPNFTGSTCEQCESGFFGPSCSPCPAGCSKCDEGVTGSGRCLDSEQSDSPLDTCNCLNGQCSGNGGSCTCNSGWTTSDNGTACAKCAEGFFLSSTGSCNVCAVGCTKCSDRTGECLSCKSGFSLDANDKTRCNPPQSTDSTGAVCPSGSFGTGTGACTPCDNACDTCSGPTSNDCITCADDTYLFNGKCVSVDNNGACQIGSGGPSMFADNNKGECDSCPAKCTACGIPNFSRASTSNQVQCTACIPGTVLFQGECLGSCPSGMFKDGNTCSSCDSSCSSCSGSASFCTACPSGKLSFNGACVDECPTGSTQDSGSNSCSACHPDCATCSGPSISQCTSCPPSNPALSNNRCLSICNKGQFLDPESSSCRSCDSSCSSCSGPGSDECLACSSPTQVLREGKCVEAPCASDGSGTSPISGLGACLSELVVVPQASGTVTPSALPSITGLTTPTTERTTNKLEWWQILLMALGCAFIFLVFIFFWRRRMRKKRQWETRVFARKRNLGQGWGWNSFKLGWLGFFGRARSRRAREQQEQTVRLQDIKRVPVPTYHDYDDVEQAQATQQEKDKLDIFDSYYQTSASRTQSMRSQPRQLDNRVATSSMYSELTGQARNTPEPRQPVKDVNLHDNHGLLANSKLRNSIRSERSFISSSDGSRYEPEPLIPLSRAEPTRVPSPFPTRSCPSPAQEYASAVKPALSASPPLPGNLHWLSTMQTEESQQSQPQYSLTQQPTGSTTFSSRNPFRR